MSFTGCPMSILVQKLKALKAELKSWNKSTFGDVHQRVESAVKMVDQIQAEFDAAGSSDDLVIQEANAQSELQQALKCQEELWKDKARLNWHYFGDRNSAFFHKVTKIRNTTKQLTILKKGDTILDQQQGIENRVLDFYKNLFASVNRCSDNGLVESFIPPLVSAEDNSMLTKLPSMEEVRSAVFSMNASGAPGPDGFGGIFFQHFWYVVAEDVFKSVNQFFVQSWILPSMNSNLVVLIPKTSNANR